eukprot:CCRYP_014870-RA/>CCRYP_014870-RA protein AED:0.47 eAED:0.47 QI:0/0/0/0.5/0/0.5/2/0/534
MKVPSLSRPDDSSIISIAKSVVSRPKNAASKVDSSSNDEVIDLASLADESSLFLDAGKKAWNGYHLCAPTGKMSNIWKFYLLFHQTHSDKQKKAKCHFVGCNHEVNIEAGSSGLRSDLKFKHTSAWYAMNTKTSDANSKASSSGSASVISIKATHSSHQPRDPKVNLISNHYPKQLTIEEKQQMFLGTATYWAIDQNIPFSACEAPSFRRMFDAFSHDACKIVTRANRASVRENLRLYGLLTKLTTKLDMKKHKGSWTSDHWTSSTNETYTCNTFHYIENWEKHNRLIDLEVFYSSTKGKDLYKYQKKILEPYADVFFVFMAVLDTTGNRGVLTQECRKDGHEAAYCTEHSIHLNASLAFKVGVLQDVITRWWSTHCMVNRLIYLCLALQMMVANNVIDADIFPNNNQWSILEDVEKTLLTMSKWQRVLEGEHFVTASLVMVAVYQIRANYVKMILDGSTSAPAVALAQILLKDFDERYRTTDSVSGKCCYTGKADIGFRNRCTGVHPYFVIASMLDPCIKNMLPQMIETNQYK